MLTTHKGKLLPTKDLTDGYVLYPIYTIHFFIHFLILFLLISKLCLTEIVSIQGIGLIQLRIGITRESL